MTPISSPQNAVFKHIKSLADKKYRSKYSEYTVEGIKSVHDALLSGKPVKQIIISEDFGSPFDYPSDIELISFTPPLFKRLCDTAAPQGIAAVMAIEAKNSFVPRLEGAYIYCDGINDPGNLGTIIRTADAAGFDAVLLSKGSVDVYSPKVVRASMGSFFNIDIIDGLDNEFLKKCAEKGFSLFGGTLGANTVDYRSADMSQPAIIIVGNEANGINSELTNLCQCVRIPIIGHAESLNVSVAAALLMYEMSKQRKKL